MSSVRNKWRSNASSGILARYLLGQSRHQNRSRPAAKRAARHRWPARPSALTFELLEPRLLLSADIFPGTQANYVQNPQVGDEILSGFSTDTSDHTRLDRNLFKITSSMGLDHGNA